MLSEEREKANRVTYGIIYGLSPWGLAKGPGGLGIHVGQAQNLITSFLNHFSGVCHLPHWPWHLYTWFSCLDHKTALLAFLAPLQG